MGLLTPDYVVIKSAADISDNPPFIKAWKRPNQKVC